MHCLSVRSVSAMLTYRPGGHLFVGTQREKLPDGEYLSVPHLVVGAAVGARDGAMLGACVATVHSVRLALWNWPVGHCLHARWLT